MVGWKWVIAPPFIAVVSYLLIGSPSNTPIARSTLAVPVAASTPTMAVTPDTDIAPDSQWAVPALAAPTDKALMKFGIARTIFVADRPIARRSMPCARNATKPKPTCSEGAGVGHMPMSRFSLPISSGIAAPKNRSQLTSETSDPTVQRPMTTQRHPPKPRMGHPTTIKCGSWDQSRKQRLNDARAIIKESWASYGQSIASIEIGRECSVVDTFSANFAIRKIQGLMQDELINAGLLGDPTMSIKQATANYIQAAKSAGDRDACISMTPADRGRLRATVSSLMQ